MAGKRRRARTLGHITDKEVDAVQDRLDTMASREYQLRVEGDDFRADQAFMQQVGALRASEAIGMHCSCFHVTSRLTQCACAKTGPGLTNKIKRKTAQYARFKRLAKERAAGKAR